MYFLSVVFIEGIQYKPQEFCERNGFADDEERFFFFSKAHVTSIEIFGSLFFNCLQD